MRIGVYIDGYNLYYGARSIMGRGTSGWRWLDVRTLTQGFIDRSPWGSESHELKIVYCTARIDQVSNPSGHADQWTYLESLRLHSSVDHIEYGNYVSRVKYAPMAVKGNGGRPKVVTADWPVRIKDGSKQDISDAVYMVSYLHNEEKGSDVNVATHLLTDVLSSDVDAALVISNDSDLKLPFREARKRVPFGWVNPSRNAYAGDLRSSAEYGIGNHWWAQLKEDHLRDAQLPNKIGNRVKPAGW